MKEITIMIHRKKKTPAPSIITMGSADCLAINLDEKNFKSEIRNLTGSFAIIAETSKNIILICDYIRSIPLFYHITEKEIVISDSAEEIKRKRKVSIKKDNVDEFLCTGYVTETETLFENVFQVLPGQCVIISKNDAEIQKIQYFSLKYQENVSLKFKEEWIDRYDSCLQEVFRELTKRLNGRTVLVPLSGGCDSRTVAVMLKRLNYPHVICFSYGRKGNLEAETSKQIAGKLGYPWYFVEYTGDKWKKYLKEDFHKEFLSFACRGTNVGCIQALPAMIELVKRKEIPQDAVVIPGHTMDFLAGGHIGGLCDREEITKEELVDFIISHHYDLNKGSQFLVAVKKWSEEFPKVMDRTEAVGLYQLWEWKNRQAKFIANDVRTYEYVGLDWELPFWDVRVLEFWMSVPIELLKDRKLQYEHMVAKIDPVAHIVQNYFREDKDSTSYIERIKDNIKKMLPVLIKVYELYLCLQQRCNNGNAFYDYISWKKYLGYMRKYGEHFSVNTIESDSYIRYLQDDLMEEEQI